MKHSKYLLPLPIATIAFLVFATLQCSGGRGPYHPGYEDPPEYIPGVSVADLGLEITPLCDPVQITDGEFNKKIPAIAVSGGMDGEPYLAHVIWSEPDEGKREIFESVGFLDEFRFTGKMIITQSDGERSFNPAAFSDPSGLLLGYMDESVNTREIWFRNGNIGGWDDPVILSDENLDSRSWGANPLMLYTTPVPTGDPVMIWFDHRYTKHEIVLKVKQDEWGQILQITEDEWFQFDPHADVSSTYDGIDNNVIHLVYMDSRYTDQEDKHAQHEGNTEILYKMLKPNLQNEMNAIGWEIGPAIQLSFTEGVSDLPRVCGIRFAGNENLESAGVVWHEIDETEGTGEIHYSDVTSGTRGKLRRLTPPDTVALNPSIASVPVEGYENLRAVAYQQYEEGEEFPLGVSNIYLQLIEGDRISEPVKISDSAYVCSHPRFCVPGFNAENERTLLIAWSEYRAGRPKFGGESQIFFRAFRISAPGDISRENDLSTTVEMDYN